MMRLVLAAILAPLALATTVPLPRHGPKQLPPQARKMIRDHLQQIHQFDLAKLGIPVEKSLRLVGAVGNPAHPSVLVAISPRKMEPLLAWYRGHLKGWKLTGHTRGKTGALTPPKGDARVSVTACLGGTYQLFPCASVVRFYEHTGR